MNVCAVDAGTTSGLVCLVDGKWTFFELDSGSSEVVGVSWLAKKILKMGIDVCIIESFRLRLPIKSVESSGLSSARMGFGLACMLDCLGFSGSVVWSQPSNMATIGNARLRALGFWVIGSEHCRDAMRHLAVYGRKEGMWMPGVKREKVEKVRVR